MKKKIGKRYLFKITLTLAILSQLIGGAMVVQGVPLTQSTTFEPRVSNLGDTTAIITWTTDAPVTCEVRYGTAALDQAAYDIRDQFTSDDTHIVALANLGPETTYLFDIACDGVVDDNNGVHYTFITGSMLGISVPDTIYGTVYQPGGMTPAGGALAHLRILDTDGMGSSGQSGWLSALVEDSGVWISDLSGARTGDGSALFSYTDGDQIEIEIIGGSQGQATMAIPLHPHFPVPDITLDGSGKVTLEIPLGLGWNLVSIHIIPDDPTLPKLFSSIDGFYDIVWAYDGCDGADPWKRFNPNVPFGNDLISLDCTMGFWIYMNAAATLTVTGTLPAATDIPLCDDANGWNLVGWPASEASTLPGALSAVDGFYDNVLTYPWKRYVPGKPINDLTEMEPGRGYWIHVTGDVVLPVAY